MQSHQQLASLRLDDERRDWASLPLDLLKVCLGAPQLELDEAAKRAALSSCNMFGRAVVQSSTHALLLAVDQRRELERSTQIWRELWGQEQPRQGQEVALFLFSLLHGSPRRCLHELLSGDQRMAFVTTLVLQGLSLDVVLPEGVSALLPNLEQLFLDHCVLTPAARTTLLDAGCSALGHLDIKGLAVAPQPALAGAASSQPTPSLQQLATAQLRQLAKLPSLSSIALMDSSCPTLFLVALGTHLTRLDVHEAYRQCEPGTQTPTPAWRATLQHVARCTRLQELIIPCATAEELGVVGSALRQLSTLTLRGHVARADGDALVEALLGLPHLTSLHWNNLSQHCITRWHNTSPCRWDQLTLAIATPQQLARLPLHSLKQPAELWSLYMASNDTPLREVRAAVANVTLRCPAGFRWSAYCGEPPRIVFASMAGGDSEADVPAVLRALRPTFASLTSFVVIGVRWDVGRVKALGEVLPRTCTRLVLYEQCLSKEALEQVARSLPWVRRLDLREQRVLPEEVVQHVRLARRLKEEGAGGQGAVCLEELLVERPVRPRGMSEAEHKRGWEEAERAVRMEEGGVVLKVEW